MKDLLQKIAIRMTHKLLLNIKGINERIAIRSEILRKLRDFVLKSRNAPKNVPIVLAMK